MAWYLNTYSCPCGQTWESPWSCMCDDECGACGKDICADEDSEDVTIIIERAGNGWAVRRSPDTAEDDPEYEWMGGFPTEEAAKHFARKLDALNNAEADALQRIAEEC